MYINSQELETLIKQIVSDLLQNNIVPINIINQATGNLIAQEVIRLVMDEGDVLFNIAIVSLDGNSNISDFTTHTIKRGPQIHWDVDELPSHVPKEELREFYTTVLKKLTRDLHNFQLKLIDLSKNLGADLISTQ